MKKIILITVSAFLLLSSMANGQEPARNEKTDWGNPATIICSPDLYSLTQQWVSDYSKSKPGLNLTVKVIDPTEVRAILATGSNIGFISDSYYQTLENKEMWKVMVGRDIIVPIINSLNPLIEQINVTGVSSTTMAEMLGAKNSGNFLTKNGNQIPLNFYVTPNETISQGVLDFTGINPKNLNGKTVSNGKELVTAVQNDPFGIGFCKLTDLIDKTNQALAANISILPIDKNGNGQLDYYEKIYDNLNDFSRGVWIGKYPLALTSNLYSIANRNPENEAQRAFLKWVLTDGQAIMESNGYTELLASERQSKVERIIEPEIIKEAETNQYAILKIALLALSVLIIGGVAANALFGGRKKITHGTSPDHPTGLTEESLNIPKGLYFDKTHTWTFMETDGNAKVGIDDFLHHVTGKFTRVMMKNPGEKIKKNEQLLSLAQNGKQLNIYSPISGTIKNINKKLASEPSLINSSPYNEGWLYVIEPSNWLREIQFLKMAAKYREWLRLEFLRLKDFLATTANTENFAYAHVSLQDGGELKDNVLQDLNPELWEDFQKQFIDNSEFC